MANVRRAEEVALGVRLILKRPVQETSIRITNWIEAVQDMIDSVNVMLTQLLWQFTFYTV
jgi:hypothetical protein